MSKPFREASILLILSCLLSSTNLSFTNDSMNTSQSLRQRYNETLVSARGFFELGFFSPGNSNKWYLGIWYKNVPGQTVVWVANTEAPLKHSSSGVLQIKETGDLILLNETHQAIWSSKSNTSGIGARNPVIQLMDTGNLVVLDTIADHDQYLWKSFDHPTDTLLPGTTFGTASVYLTSSKTNEDPSPGEYVHFLDTTGYPQIFTTKSGVPLYRIGPWNGVVFGGTPQRSNKSYTLGVYRNEKGQFYIRDDNFDLSIMKRVTLNSAGTVELWQWVDQTGEWVVQMRIPVDSCDEYNKCGAYGSCAVGKFPICLCLDKFKPGDPKAWGESAWSESGCIRRMPLNCSTDGFVKYANLKLPDARGSWHDERMTLEECRDRCLRNCRCTAYASLNVSGGRNGCLMYFGDLVDMKVISTSDQDLYIRMAFLDSDEMHVKKKKNVKLTVSMAIIGAMILIGFSIVLYVCKRNKNEKIGTGRNTERHDEGLELPIFDLVTISKATDGFSVENKIGEGGYGPVYKGTMDGGQDIAVKRLSESSQQGLNELKNEAIFITKLQHRNLVKLLGFCIQGEEKMLIYEYMPNRSLDKVLFDQENGMHLDWATRFHIINGIARGLMYLHEDSRLRIIHRDLKASNILLDHEMNPKISDFGIAKSCKGNEIKVTSRVIGTYGYMPPEYAIFGRFSTKSDVFSFGVIVLEIVSGKRNNSYSPVNCDSNLLAQAWTLLKEGQWIEVVDNCLKKSNALGQVLRAIHVGLLCVQRNPHDRPCMTSVVTMLSNDIELAQPDYPGFYTKTLAISNVSSNPKSSTNEMTITLLGGR